MQGPTATLLETATLLAAVWWAWNYTAWATNWLNPDHAGGRRLMAVAGPAVLLAGSRCFTG